MTFRKFPSIEQFRNNIRAVRNRVSYAGKDADGNPIYNHCIFPTLHLVGTVKVHGTNASIAQMKSGAEIEYGSRNGPITPESDNAGFATYHECTLKDSGFDIKSHFEDIRTVLKHDGPIYIYGEWAGGNIQSGVAINGLPKMFIPFAIALYSDDTEEATRTWVLPHHTELLNSTYAPTANWFPIHLFGLHEIDIDYNTPEMVQNKLVEIMQAIEQECPVGKHFGKLGVGEGAVWYITDPTYDYADFVMKIKGEKHSVSKVKTTASVDVEKLNSINEMVENFVTENRLKQGLDFLAEQHLDAEPKNLGPYIKWVIGDIAKEEMDVFEASGIEFKEFAKSATTKIRQWFLSNLK